MNWKQKPKILVFGSTGTVGSAIVEVAAASGKYEIHAVARHHNYTPKNVVTYDLDLRNGRAYEAFSSMEFTHIVDCAQPRYSNGDIQDFGVDHIKNIESLCTAVTESLVYTSGVWVYGNQDPGRRISEKSPLRPINYAKPRIPVLEYLTDTTNKPWIQLCPPSIVYGKIGPLQDIARQILNSEAEIIDDESIEWSVIERIDLARAYLSIFEKLPQENLFCIAEKESVPVVQFYDKIAKLLGKSVPKASHREMEQKCSSNDFEVIVSNQPVDSSLIRRSIDWKCEHRFLDDYESFLTNI